MKKQFTVFIFTLVLLFVAVGCGPEEVTEEESSEVTFPPGGGIYTGEVNKDGEPHGQGTAYFEVGKIKYEGEFKDGEWHGQGTLYFEDGTIIHKGEFKDGESVE